MPGVNYTDYTPTGRYNPGAVARPEISPPTLSGGAVFDPTGTYGPSESAVVQYGIDKYGALSPLANVQPSTVRSTVTGGDVGIGNEYAQRALAQLAAAGQSQGLDPQGLAALRQAQMGNALASRVQNAMAAQQAQAAGRLRGSGALAAILNNNNAANTATALGGAQASRDANLRALQALASSGQGNLALGASQFNQAANAGQARDAANMFNAQQRANAQQNAFSNAAKLAEGKIGQAEFGEQLSRGNEGEANAARNMVAGGVFKGLTGGLGFL